ncbi:hypothetical protein [Bacillus pseudomycoides]|uniref:hypothetical protein n=1 Tax=Bacillus pseudomycoides TaxID=64104 RepID=UPI001596C851|nr:hypothetical protein [Bacillus pseudomycoides]
MKKLYYSNDLRTYSIHLPRLPYDNYQSAADENTHNVVVQEYDNVVAILDQYFFYDENGKLNTRAYYYDATKMLFQMVTRIRKKLNIIIIINQVVLKKYLEISHPNKG